jgi:hypothetical protein
LIDLIENIRTFYSLEDIPKKFLNAKSASTKKTTANHDDDDIFILLLLFILLIDDDNSFIFNDEFINDLDKLSRLIFL